MKVLQKNCNVARLNFSGGESMSKIRVYEYAKKHNISSKDVINKLKRNEYRGFKSYGNIRRCRQLVNLDATYNKNEATKQNTS